jgi:hypothetical protein
MNNSGDIEFASLRVVPVTAPILRKSRSAREAKVFGVFPPIPGSLHRHHCLRELIVEALLLVFAELMRLEYTEDRSASVGATLLGSMPENRIADVLYVAGRRRGAISRSSLRDRH